MTALRDQSTESVINLFNWSPYWKKDLTARIYLITNSGTVPLINCCFKDTRPRGLIKTKLEYFCLDLFLSNGSGQLVGSFCSQFPFRHKFREYGPVWVSLDNRHRALICCLSRIWVPVEVIKWVKVSWFPGFHSGMKETGVFIPLCKPTVSALLLELAFLYSQSLLKLLY